jgi:hypothetical protein
VPVPGPRTQHGPVPGYTNPDQEGMNRINHWGQAPPVSQPGRTPGLMYVNVRGEILGPGTIRRMWYQTVNYIGAQAPYSWTGNGNLQAPTRPAGITRALRYMTRSTYMGSGIDNTRFAGLHTEIYPQVRSKPVTLGAGQVRTRPTVRNRMTSFGSRVPTLNQPVQGAQPSSTSA